MRVHSPAVVFPCCKRNVCVCKGKHLPHDYEEIMRARLFAIKHIKTIGKGFWGRESEPGRLVRSVVMCVCDSFLGEKGATNLVNWCVLGRDMSD